MISCDPAVPVSDLPTVILVTLQPVTYLSTFPRSRKLPAPFPHFPHTFPPGVLSGTAFPTRFAHSSYLPSIRLQGGCCLVDLSYLS